MKSTMGGVGSDLICGVYEPLEYRWCLCADCSVLVTGRFTPRRFTPRGIQRFLVIQLKPKHRHLDVFNYSCHSMLMPCW